RAWINSIIAAVRWLHRTEGITTISLCGLRIGAALAARAASELDAVDALILLAPIARGRQFLREQTLTARTVADIWQSHATIDDGQWFEAYGLRMDRATRDALDTLDISKLNLTAVRRALWLDQPGAPPTDRLVNQLRTQITVTHEIGDGLDRVLHDSHEAE